MGVLIVSDDLKAEIQRIRDFADKQENWYTPHKGPPPGDNPRHTGSNGTFRFVFSITFSKDQTYRHLSVSTSGPKWPNPAAVFTIAHLFGFTGADASEDGFVMEPAKDWGIKKEDPVQAVIVLQRLP